MYIGRVNAATHLATMQQYVVPYLLPLLQKCLLLFHFVLQTGQLGLLGRGWRRGEGRSQLHAQTHPAAEELNMEQLHSFCSCRTFCGGRGVLVRAMQGSACLLRPLQPTVSN